ncbi:hypothetical protein ACQPYK_02005 [Streptosporangium sp. CA-135522]|uniref:hypothetical protein n=1 Tax=Streptosporangium sp. CA-135522 TaxID=3240072 RepID=UPI003D933AFA
MDSAELLRPCPLPRPAARRGAVTVPTATARPARLGTVTVPTAAPGRPVRRRPRAHRHGPPGAVRRRYRAL